ncbi:unnamed protein product [Closterium sp. NIES-53]
MGDRAGQTCGKPHTQHRCFSCLDVAWRAEFGDEAKHPRWAELLRSGVAIFDLDNDAILAAMYALSLSAEGDCYLCVLPDLGIEAASLGASESALPGTAPAAALHTFMLHSGASRCLHLPSFSTNLVSTTALQDAMVTTTTPGGQRVSIYTCTWTGRHLATFTRWPRSSLYTLATEPPHVAGSAQVSASGPVAPPCSCRLLSHQTLLPPTSFSLIFPGHPSLPRLGHPSLPRLHGMHSHLLLSDLPRSLPPLPPLPAPPYLPCVEGRQRAAPHSSFPPTTAPLKGEIPDVLITWIRAVRLQLRERFRHDLPVLRLHCERGGEFSSDFLRDFCCGDGILQSFTLPASPQQNGIAERHIGLVMEVARTSMIHAAAPHFLWPFAVRYAAHQLNLWPRVSSPETSLTLRWTGEVGDASVFGVCGYCAFVRDTSADKLSSHAIPCIFLGFPPDAPAWQFYHPTLRRVFPSQGVTFDKSVLFYRLFPFCSAPPPPPPLFLAPCPPQVDPLPPQGPAPSGVSQVDPLPGTVPVEVAPGGAQPGGAQLGGAEPGGAEPEGVEPWGAESEGAEFGGAEPRGTASSGGPAGASPRLSPRHEPLSPQQLHEWFAQCTRLRSGAAGAGVSAPGDTGAGGAADAGPGGARNRGTGAAGTGSVGGAGAGAGDPAEPGGVGAGGTGAGGAGAGGAGAGDTKADGARAGGTGAGGAGAGGAGAGDTGTVDPGAGGAGAGGAVSGGTGAGDSPLDRREPKSRPALPVRAVCTGRRVPRSRPPPVPSTHAMALRPSSVPLRVPLPPPESSLPAVPDPESDLARAASPSVSRLLATDPSFESTAVSALVAELVDFAAACRLDYATALVAESESASPPSVRDAIMGPYFSQWQAAMDAEMASWKSTGTYVDAVPPSRANIVDGMWIFRVKRPPGSLPSFKARYVARGFSQQQGVDYFQTFSPTPKMTTLRVLLHVAAQRDYKLHSLDFSTAFLQGSLHEEIWLRRPPGFTGSFLAVGVVSVTGVGADEELAIGAGAVVVASASVGVAAVGFMHVCDADYDKTYSPVSSFVTLRIFLSIVAVLDLNLMQLDMKNAFLHSELDRVLYMYKPDYFDDGTSRVCKLLNSLYGLKQSPLLWYRALDGVLLGVGWKKSQVDKALYFKAGDNGVTSWVLVYVDDLFAASSSPPMLKELKEPLEAAFELRKISLVVKYLGLEIVRDRPARKLWLHQQGYADKLRRRFIDEELGGRVLKASVSVDAYAELTFDDEEAQ